MRRILFLISIYCVTVMPLASQGISVGPFILYEQAQSDLVIDGVTSGYKFGAAGLSTDIKINNRSTLITDIGVGYIPSETISFGGATFSGPFGSRYLSSKLVYNIKEFDSANLHISSSFSHRHAFSNSLIGTKNSATLNGKAVNIINSLEALVGFKFLQNTGTNFIIGLGLSAWSFNATGVAANLSDTVRAIKNLSELGIDPMLEAIYHSKNANKNLELAFRYRSLNSKLNNGIFSLGLSYKYVF